MADFRPCTICLSNSQADLSHSTFISEINQNISTFARLRYYLGGRRPSETTLYKLLSKI